MGYRSDIAFAIQTEKPIEGLHAILKIAEFTRDTTEPFTNTQEVNDAFKDIVSHLRVHKDKNLMTFYVTQWKWYSDCQCAHGFLMDLAGNYDNDFCAKFVRIGETADDVEEDAWGDAGWDLDYPYVVRRIELDDTFKEGD
jgi:hypothetical protein